MTKIEEFAGESSIHGVKFVFAVGQIRSTRIFFFCSMLFSLFGFSYYIYSAYYKFMFVPETVTRSYDVRSTNFPAPAVTICSNLFAREDFANFFKTYQKYINKQNFSISILECKYLIGNLHWCQSGFSKMVQKVCGMYDLKNLNILDAINKSALQTDEMLFNCLGGVCESLVVRVFTVFGICYAYNMQGFNAIFNTDVIDKDFKCYKRLDYDNVSDVQWTPEKGYPTPETEFPQRADRGQMIYHQPYLSPIEKENICALKTYRIFLHKPNEILTPFHESTFLNYDEYLEFFIYPKSHRTDEALRRFSPQVRNCYFEGERVLKFFKVYTKALCEYECSTNQTLKECGCVKFSMPRTKNTTICTIDELRCTESLSSKHCECFPSCIDIKYNYRYDRAAFNRRFFEGIIPATYSMSWVQFTIDSEFVEEIENFVTYKLHNYLGGLLGLFLGCSLISIVEIVYYTTGGLLGFLWRSKPSIPAPSEKKPSSVKKITPSKGFDSKGFEMQVSNNDILHALNALTRTVHDNDTKIRRILREHGEKILHLEEQNEPMSIYDMK